MSLLSRAWSVIKTLLIPTPAIPVTLPPSLTFAGETILITGGTSGLGLSAAILFTTLHASTVIITARTAAKGDVARRLIEAETGRTGVVAVRVLDMDSFAGVRAFVAALKQAVPRVDRVLLNAGVHNFHYERLAGGWEADLQVNVLSTALLGVLVLDWMRAGAAGGKGGAPHLVFVGSGAHIEAVDVGDGTWPGQDVLGFWNRETSFVNGRMQYGASKLLLQYVAREVAALAGGKEGRPSPIVNSVCPGMIKTNITRDFTKDSLFFTMVEKVFMWIKAAPVERGGKSLVLATTTNEAQHGMFLRPYMTDEEYDKAAEGNITGMEGRKMQARVWKEVVGVLKDVAPEIEDIVQL